ncbi:hypothetical protein FRC08_010657 [Ceratobasidium sp. 394]|nr:hypothetical protein FRC08_010657 [Ceratobasidium sp. 394]
MDSNTHLPMEQLEPGTTIARGTGHRALILETCASEDLPGLRSPSSYRRDIVQLFEARGYETESANVEFLTREEIIAQITSFCADVKSDDLVILVYFSGHGSYFRDDWWEDIIQDNTQPGSIVGTINMEWLSSDYAQRRAILGSLSAGSSGSNANQGATRITISARRQDQQTDTLTFEIQLLETLEYYSDSIELLSIALDSISEIVSVI